MTSKRTDGSNAKSKMKRKAYDRELQKLQIELCHLQGWVKETGARIIILFEGRDAAGKGGTIKAITERVVALPAPSDREKRRCLGSVTFSSFPQRARS
jgi:polyphosphate kinase 2 (PPK2 family)